MANNYNKLDNDVNYTDYIDVNYTDYNDVKQVLAMKYIVRRLVALFIVAAVIAVPAVLGAVSYIRDMGADHSKVGSETEALSYSQVEPYIRMYIDGEMNAEDSQTAAGKENGQSATSGAIKARESVAVGTVLMYAGDKTPKGFLRCDGRKVSREKYKALYAVIGDKYGAGDGKTTFNLPNMRTQLPVDTDSDVYVGEGSATDKGTLAADATAQGASETVAHAADTVVTSAEFAFKKVSEPTGPPPAADTDKGRTEDSGADGETSADVAIMYFIIKY